MRGRGKPRYGERDQRRHGHVLGVLPCRRPSFLDRPGSGRVTMLVDDGDLRIFVGDALDVLRGMPDRSVDCCVTSPPYWGLRDYGTGSWDGGNPDCDHIAKRGTPAVQTGLGYPSDGGPRRVGEANTYNEGAFKEQFRDVCGKCGATRVDRQLGLETTPDEYVTNMVAVFREVRRVLADHGTCWINLGDSYAAGNTLGRTDAGRNFTGGGGNKEGSGNPGYQGKHERATGLKPKDLVGIPWRVAFALQADGWYLRSDIIWAKKNCMPESVTDRPTKAHEYVFLLSKQPRYWFDQEAVRERYIDGPGLTGGAYSPPGQSPHGNARGPDGRRVTAVVGQDGSEQHRNGERWPNGGRNVRSVWEIATQPYAQAHFATFPEELPRRCILAGCPEWVCSVCGKPRERIVESESSWSERKANGAEQGSGYAMGGPRDGRSGDQNTVHGAGMSHDLTPRARRELGWSDCGHGAYQPGTVLDPFLGAGTTALVARKHGRRSVGIELNPAYAALAADRCSQLSLLSGGEAA